MQESEQVLSLQTCLVKLFTLNVWWHALTCATFFSVSVCVSIFSHLWSHIGNMHSNYVSSLDAHWYANQVPVCSMAFFFFFCYCSTENAFIIIITIAIACHYSAYIIRSFFLSFRLNNIPWWSLAYNIVIVSPTSRFSISNYI